MATQLGLELSYQTIWGHLRHVASDTANALATSLVGATIDLDDTSQLHRFLESTHAASAAKLTPNLTLVESAATPLASLILQLTPAEQRAPIELLIQWENTALTTCRLGDPNLTQLATPGYHTLNVRTATRQAEICWILTPNHCHFPPGNRPLNGINCFLPSIRSQRNWGCGDLTDLLNFAKLLREHTQLDFIALNPLHAIHNRTPYNTSPYLPLSIFTHNLLYLDIESLPEFNTSPLVQRLVQASEIAAQLTALRESNLVEYEKVARLKTFFLLLLYRQFKKQASSELKNYRKCRGPWLDNYCTYMAFDRYFHRRDPNSWHWHHWPPAFQSPNSEASRALKLKLARLIDFLAFIEMRFEQQLDHAHQQVKTLGYALGLYHDLALATDRVGADYWAYQDLFAAKVRVGSPPDDFNENGQDWGFPALHPQRHADSGYRYFIESIRCASRAAGAIRLDHVMRLARLYWIPDGMSARDGAYVRDNFHDLLRILSLESQRGRLVVVGEDLGTVPDYFRKALDDFGILSYRLILFERHGDDFRTASEYPQQAIAAFTTHDLPTFDGWLSGRDLEARVQAGTLNPQELPAARSARAQAITHLRIALQLSPQETDPDIHFTALCRFLAASPSQMRLINLEELTGEQEQQNLPGTTSEASNWQHPLATNLESLHQNAAFRRRLGIWAASLSRVQPQ